MKLDYSDLFKNTPFSMAQKKKEIWFLERMKILCDHHYKYCLQYRSLTEKVFQPFDKCDSLLDLSFVPANLFKKNNLKTVITDSELKVFTSSGTSTNGKSKNSFDRKK